MKLNQTYGDESIYDPVFIHLMEDNLQELIDNVTNSVAVKKNQAIRWEGDYYGLLKELGVSPKLFLPTLRVNGFSNPAEYTADILSVKLPSETLVQTLLTKL